MPSYPRPPITEAVIEIRFDQPVPKELLDKVRARALEKYPLSDEVGSVGLRLEPAKAAAQVKQEWLGYKLTNVDGTEILMFQSQIFSTSRLAPYPGGLAHAGVGKIIDCGAEFGIKLRVLHHPLPENTGYAGVQNVPRENHELLEMIATDAVVETTMVDTIESANAAR
jgi:hypothetical protein